MKSLMLTQTYFPSVGGGIRYKVGVVEGVRGLGHECDVLCVNTEARLSVEHEVGGCVVRSPQLRRFGSTQVSPSYLWLFGQMAPKYDVLHFNFPSPMCELALLRHRGQVRGARKVAMYHADIVPAKRFSAPYNRWVTSAFLEEMDSIIVSSPNILESSPHLAPHRSKVCVIPFGLEQELFERKDAEAEEPRAGAKLRVLFVGRVARYKGVEHLVDAVQGLPVELTVVGEGPLRAEMTERAQANGAGDSVRFLGFVDEDELLRQYHQADVLVLPSTDAGEAFGYVLIEAMMCGAAVISTELGTGTSFVNAHGVSGEVVPPKDVPALAEVLGRLAADRELLGRYKSGARQRALEEFTIDRMIRETVELYQ